MWFTNPVANQGHWHKGAIMSIYDIWCWVIGIGLVIGFILVLVSDANNAYDRGFRDGYRRGRSINPSEYVHEV